ncbi:MAG: hypothetical protein COY92_14280 [Shewanella sp. CG_4_10_14_0_8_um_filter_42_13]|nr:MAG: hypothetical protein COZ42_06685 [Shewanella sp. CG_4_10_14_3_um_filter_42_91]PIY65004.1 MAG: hypothetical protein COY92_14280 [Shewanella sp. CG_4_10_14_0_8_um_filter_42_13]
MYLFCVILVIFVSTVLAEIYIAINLKRDEYELSKEIDDSKIGEVYRDDGINRDQQTVNAIRASYLTLIIITCLLLLLLASNVK